MPGAGEVQSMQAAAASPRVLLSLQDIVPKPVGQQNDREAQSLGLLCIVPQSLILRTTVCVRGQGRLLVCEWQGLT